jgi:hypothetical protein
MRSGLPFIDYSARFQEGNQESPLEALTKGYQTGLLARQAKIDELKYLKEQQNQASLASLGNAVKAGDYGAISQIALINPAAANAVLETTKYRNGMAANLATSVRDANVDEKPARYQQMLAQLSSMGMDISGLPRVWAEGTGPGALQWLIDQNKTGKEKLEEEGAKLKNSETTANIRAINALTEQRRQSALTEKTQQLKNLRDTSQASAEKTSNLRKELNQQLGTFRDVRNAYDNIVVSAQNPSPAGDMSLIFAYMKMLDPSSTVREGEYAAVENARGVPEGIRNLYNNIIEGKLLTQKQRGDFTNRANSLYKVAEKNAQKTIKQYEGIATRAGLNPQDVLIDFASENKQNRQNPKQFTAANGVRATIEED